MRDLVGEILDDTYRIERLIGQGGMGAVYLAHDLALDRDVAIKVMHDHIAREEGFRSRFLQEARAVAALDHPNIVRIHAFSRNPELLYIVMAVVGQGRTLRDWLAHLREQGVLLELDAALALVEQLADALGYAHARGVTHRDIKPGNILLQPLQGETSGTLGVRPVLTDFGLAKLARGSVQTMPGQALGTPAYMAPEQCLGQAVDGRADIYALGVVSYELVTGRPPFAVQTLPEALQAHAHQAPPPPRLVAPDLPSDVEEVVLKALAKDPAARYQTGEAMRDAVSELRRRVGRRRGDTPAAEASQASMAWLTQGAFPPAPSEDAWPTPPSDALPGARIVVLRPDGAAEAVSLPDGATLAVGREADNDLVLASPAVSRHHVRISCEGQRVRVTDLNSTNGTFLDGERILPGVAERWQPGHRLRIGGYWLTLEGVSATPTPAPFVATHVGTAQPTTALELRLSPEALMLEPGQQAQLTAEVLNRQSHVDHFYARVEGLPESWLALPADDLLLAPGDSGSLAIRVALPADVSAPAGEQPFVVHIMSRADATRHAEARGTLAVKPVHRVELTLQPSVYTDAGEGVLTVANRGNSREELSLSARDPADAVHVQLAANVVSLPPGGSQTVAVAVGPGARAPAELYQTLPFTIVAQYGDRSETSVSGTLSVRPRSRPAPEPPHVVAEPPPAAAARPRPPEPAPPRPAAPRPASTPVAHPVPPESKPKAGFWRILLGIATLGAGLFGLVLTLNTLGYAGLVFAGFGVALAVSAAVRCFQGRAKMAVVLWLLALSYVTLRMLAG